MSGFHVLLCLCCLTCCLTLLPAARNTILHFGPCRISMSMSEIRAGFTAIKANIQARDPIRTLSILSHPHSLHRVQSDVLRNINKVFAALLLQTSALEPLLRASNAQLQCQLTDKCCIIHKIFNFYVDKVFKHCQTENSYINRKISSIANSFLSIKRKLERCHDENKCLCGQEPTERFQQILVNYEGLNVTSAAMKSLGELDILLDWMETSP